MIIWKDFILDEHAGPQLNIAQLELELCKRPALIFKNCRKRNPGSPSIRKNAIEIQETGQVRQPARMAGYSSLDSTQVDMDVDRSLQVTVRQRGSG